MAPNVGVLGQDKCVAFGLPLWNVVLGGGLSFIADYLNLCIVNHSFVLGLAIVRITIDQSTGLSIWECEALIQHNNVARLWDSPISAREVNSFQWNWYQQTRFTHQNFNPLVWYKSGLTFELSGKIPRSGVLSA
jgi:hypothetical protein